MGTWWAEVVAAAAGGGTGLSTFSFMVLYYWDRSARTNCPTRAVLFTFLIQTKPCLISLCLRHSVHYRSSCRNSIATFSPMEPSNVCSTRIKGDRHPLQRICENSTCLASSAPSFPVHSTPRERSRLRDNVPRTQRPDGADGPGLHHMSSNNFLRRMEEAQTMQDRTSLNLTYAERARTNAQKGDDLF